MNRTQLAECNATQAATIKRLWMQIARLEKQLDGATRRNDKLVGALERASKRKPTPQEIAAVIFGDDP